MSLKRYKCVKIFLLSKSSYIQRFPLPAYLKTWKMDPDVALRYNEKVNKFCGDIDPYTLTPATAKDPLPCTVHYFDICNYCIGKDSSYTHEAFKAYKSLEAFKLYESGWIQSILCKSISTGFIFLARVIFLFD